MARAHRPHEPLPAYRRGGLPLLLAALLTSTADGMLMVALPYLTLSLGGTPGQVGLVGGLPRLVYVLGLLLGRPLLERIDLRRMAVSGCLVLAAATLAMPTASSITLVFAVVAVYGGAVSLFWPPVVGLLLAGARGGALNRRLGRFNLAWSSGMVAGPWLGGLLYSSAVAMPFWVATAMFLVAVMAMSLFVRGPVPEPAAAEPTFPSVGLSTAHGGHPPTRVFQRMAMVALVGAYLVLGLLRYQLPNLAEELTIDEATFGLVGTVLSLSLAGAFFLLGKASRWHYRAWLLWAGQAAMGASLLILLAATNAWHLGWCAVIAGQGMGLAYASHLFYGSSASGNRARVMTRHEILLSIGFVLGAYGGGLVAEATGNRALYAVGFGVILLAVAVQVAIRLLSAGRAGLEGGCAGQEPSHGPVA